MLFSWFVPLYDAFTYRLVDYVSHLEIRPVTFTLEKRNRLHIAVFMTRNKALRMCDKSVVA